MTRGGAAVVATLAAGDRFDMLDVTGDLAWGIAPDDDDDVGIAPGSATGIVGYVERDALEPDE
ncbi:hypothetical protein [Sphingomonas bacterium]|uniref:hypothetical protein n=1 Tax=Sphingomonas bacterium TaxID=1895847 RepID=UPI001C2D3BE3|nr:hypothetical protein [Sphingomonas bacterium]